VYPESIDEASTLGHEPGKGSRAIVAGIRVASVSEGPIFAATDRLPSTPTSVVALPERLGGGFLFGMGKQLWRAPSWLTPASPIFVSPNPIAQVLVGLDRAYVRTMLGVITAIDPRTGAVTDLGPLPASPSVSRVAALDAWRAVAIADLRGAMVTVDAGSTWRPLPLPIDPSDVLAVDESLLVGGPDANHQMQWWEVRPDGQTGRLPSTPRARAPEAPASAVDPVARVFGGRPLIAAIEDGWPLVDGTALVARDGAIARVRLSDGALVESSADAFGLKPARCHPLALASPANPGAFGFVCGEPRGRTIVYRWDAPAARLVEMRRWAAPREVLSSGNGALAVRGPCGEPDDAAASPPAPGAQPRPAASAVPTPEQAFCLYLPGTGWKEARFRDDDIDRARLVVLSDGRVALVHPPQGGDLSSARLTLVDASTTSEVTLVWPQLKPDSARVLRLGTWMDGFEERRQGVLGGWVDGAGTVVGLEIRTDGETRVGEYIHDAGAPVVSGRWGLGWTASRRGFETTDGGMTWRKDIDVPEPIAPSRLVRERVCGPIGCIAAGWLRVGWGAPETTPTVEPAAHVPRTHAAPALEFDCHIASAWPAEAAGPSVSRPQATPPPAAVLRPWAFPSSAYGTLSEFPACLGRPGPALPAADRGLSPVEANAGLDRTLRGGATQACLYAWGPKNGDWDQLGRWEVHWLWPWGGFADIRSSGSAQAPWPSPESARRALGQGGGPPATWVLGTGDDADHALLVARHTVGTPSADVIVLESDRVPVEVRPLGSDPFPDVESATRVNGRWYLSTSQSPGELAATVVWWIDGSTAREIARVPRVGIESRPITRLARRADGRALGLVVDGQADAVRGSAMRWVASIDLESGAVGDPELLAPTDLSDRDVALCTGDDGGWVVDVPYPGAVRIHGAAGTEASSLQSVGARVRLTRDRACVERLVGATDARPDAGAPASSAGHGRADARSLDVTVLVGRGRYALRCSKR
jgi:hypothetical protein